MCMCNWYVARIMAKNMIKCEGILYSLYCASTVVDNAHSLVCIKLTKRNMCKVSAQKYNPNWKNVKLIHTILLYFDFRIHYTGANDGSMSLKCCSPMYGENLCGALSSISDMSRV